MKRSIVIAPVLAALVFGSLAGGCAAPTDAEPAPAETAPQTTLEAEGVGPGDILNLAKLVLELNKNNLPPDIKNILFPEAIDYDKLADLYAAAAREETYKTFVASVDAKRFNMRNADVAVAAGGDKAAAYRDISTAVSGLNESRAQFMREDLKRRALVAYMSTMQLEFVGYQKLIAIDPTQATANKAVLRANLGEAVSWGDDILRLVGLERETAAAHEITGCRYIDRVCFESACWGDYWTFDGGTNPKFDTLNQCADGREPQLEARRNQRITEITASLKDVKDIVEIWRQTIDAMDGKASPNITVIDAVATLDNGTTWNEKNFATLVSNGTAPHALKVDVNAMYHQRNLGTLNVSWKCADDVKRTWIAKPGQTMNLDCEKTNQTVASMRMTLDGQPFTPSGEPLDDMIGYEGGNFPFEDGLPSSQMNRFKVYWTCSRDVTERVNTPVGNNSWATVRIDCPAFGQ